MYNYLISTLLIDANIYGQINDRDIGPGDVSFPPERTGATDMTIALLRVGDPPPECFPSQARY